MEKWRQNQASEIDYKIMEITVANLMALATSTAMEKQNGTMGLSPGSRINWMAFVKNMIVAF